MSLTELLATLNDGQLADVVDTFGGDIGKLAKVFNGASESAKSLAASIGSRLAAALGNSRGSQLINLDAQQAKELADARAAGIDTTQLVKLQAVERNKTAFDLAQQDILAWYDKEIDAKNEYITNLQDGAMKIAEAAQKFKDAFDDIALSDNSQLSPIEKLNEARKQFDDAYKIAKSTTASDTEKEAA